MKNLIRGLFFIISLAVFFISTNCWARQQKKPEIQQEKEKVQERTLQSIELLTGFGWSRLKAKSDSELKRDYNIFPIYVDFNFNLKNLTKKIGFNPPGSIQFQIEPYIAVVSSPNANVEVGNSFLFKIGILPETWKFQPYLKAGIGMVYMTQHTREQSTQFNFIDTGGMGMHYFFNNHTAFTLEGRIRHLSNAGIKQPNRGINTYQVLAGISYKY